MNDFYMQSEIDNRNRLIRERLATPHADTRGFPLSSPLTKLLGLIAFGPRVLRRRILTGSIPSAKASPPDPKALSQ